MKSIRTLLFSCLTALLLAVPVCAQAWVIEVTHGLNTSTNSGAFGFSNVLAGSSSSDIGSYAFTIKPNSGSGAVQDVATNINYVYGSFGAQGLQNQIGMILGASAPDYMSPPVAVYNTAANISGGNSFAYTFKTNTLYTLQLYNAYADPSLGGPGSMAYIAGSLSVTSPEPAKTPIPGTLLLIGPGLAGLVALRRKFKA